MKANRCHPTFLPALSSVITVALLFSSAIAQTTAPARTADNEYQTGAVLWQQSSAEIRALQHQAFLLARLMLDRDFRINRRNKRRRAVVVDVDETVLDNSRYQATLIVNRKPFESATWTNWCNGAQASAIPGAVEFLRYAASRGVRVFYVTNRRPTEREGTAKNLKQMGFPDVSDETLLLRADVSSKEARRQQISKRYRIVLLAGDNLNDFSNVFEGKTIAERAAAVEAARQKFGTEFIVLPNAMYGEWESAIYEYNSRLSEAEQNQKRKAALQTIQQ